MNLFKAGCLSSFTNSSLDQGSDGTLREFGNQVIREMLRHGLLILSLASLTLAMPGRSLDSGDLTGRAKDAKCLLPFSAGTCTGKINSYYYDPVEEKCTTFIYSGCDGNDNRFASLMDCVTTCKFDDRLDADEKAIVALGGKSVRLEKCTLAPKMCDFRIETLTYYYDAGNDSCTAFDSQGCDYDTGNAFWSAGDCLDACKFEDPGRGGKAVSGFVDGGQALVEEAAVKKRPQCLMPKHNCRLRVATPGYYYDAAKDACIFTMKSGCPNLRDGRLANKFVTRDECMQTCVIVVEPVVEIVVEEVTSSKSMVTGQVVVSEVEMVMNDDPLVTEEVVALPELEVVISSQLFFTGTTAVPEQVEREESADEAEKTTEPVPDLLREDEMTTTTELSPAEEETTVTSADNNFADDEKTTEEMVQEPESQTQSNITPAPEHQPISTLAVSSADIDTGSTLEPESRTVAQTPAPEVPISALEVSGADFSPALESESQTVTPAPEKPISTLAISNADVSSTPEPDSQTVMQRPASENPTSALAVSSADVSSTPEAKSQTVTETPAPENPTSALAVSSADVSSTPEAKSQTVTETPAPDNPTSTLTVSSAEVSSTPEAKSQTVTEAPAPENPTSTMAMSSAEGSSTPEPKSQTVTDTPAPEIAIGTPAVSDREVSPSPEPESETMTQTPSPEKPLAVSIAEVNPTPEPGSQKVTQTPAPEKPTVTGVEVSPPSEVDKKRVKHERCLLKRNSGRKGGKDVAYHYNADKEACIPFIYAGHDDNGNAFASLVQCLTTCKFDDQLTGREKQAIASVKKAVMNSRCSLPPKVCQFRLSIPSYYYKSANKTCVLFDTQGCPDPVENNNRFWTHGDCMNACLVDDPWVARVRQDLDVHSELLAGEGALQEEAAKKREKDVRCLKPKHNCKFKIFTPGYYYDAANDLCVFTIQTGCPKFGVWNQFDSEQECKTACKDD